MSTLKTRFRNIPWSEVMKVHEPHPQDIPEAWERMRGQPVEIMVPANAFKEPDQACDEPHYRVLGAGREAYCSHLIEIGD
jgi:hypothetical protein